MNELRPCPFCGGNAEFDYVEIRLKWFTKVKCKTCKGQTNIYKDEESAVEAWNRREKHE